MNYILVFCVAFIVTHVVMRSDLAQTNRFATKRSNTQNRQVIQTSRLGGIGVLVGVFTAVLIASPKDMYLQFALLFSATPLIYGGIKDDLTQSISARVRLSLGILSGVIFLLITGYVVTEIEMPVIKNLFLFYPLAFIISAFALAGVAHGMNITDGFNGLASGSATVMFIVLGLLAWRTDDITMMHISFAHAAAAFGFFCVNFPKGPILLGDGGVYYLGFALAAIVIMLIVRNPNLSPWTVTIAISYPIMEALFSIVRKLWTRGHHPFIPDNIHLHHLVYRIAISNRFGKMRRRHANPITGVALICYAVFCGLIAHVGFSQTRLAILLFICVIMSYLTTYAILTYLTIQQKEIK